MKRMLKVAIIALSLTLGLALAGCSTQGSSEDQGSGSDTNMSQSDSGGGTMDQGSTDSSQTSSQSSAYKLVEPAEAKQLIDDGQVIVVDVRTADEYAGGHIPGAINIPLDTIGTTQPAQLSDLNASVLVYCRTGVRSKQAADSLVSMGYAHVYDLHGGITAWPYETE